jgi:integrase
MRAAITKSVVDRMQAGTIVWDTRVTGFGARRQRAEGGVHYLLKAKGRWHTIGRAGSPWTAETARAEALRLLGLIVSGEDPRPEASEKLGATIELYLARRKSALKRKTFEEVERHLLKQSDPLHRYKLNEVDRRSVAELLAKIETASGPVARNRVRASLSAFWNWCIREGLCDLNPVTGTGKAEEQAKERVLSPKEIAAIWTTLVPGQNTAFLDVIHLLLLTGCRRGEIGGLRWSEIDWDQRLIVIPKERIKNNRDHTIPLSDQALIVLRRAMHDNPNGFKNDGRVFASFSWGDQKAKFDAGLGFKQHWSIHDIRRSVATLMAEKLGILPHVIEAILNHRSGHKAGVAGIYNRAKYLDEMRDALARWGEWIEANARGA